MVERESREKDAAAAAEKVLDLMASNTKLNILVVGLESCVVQNPRLSWNIVDY